MPEFVIVSASFEGEQDNKACVGLDSSDIEDVKNKNAAGHGNMKQLVAVHNQKLAFGVLRLSTSPWGTPGDS